MKMKMKKEKEKKKRQQRKNCGFSRIEMLGAIVFIVVLVIFIGVNFLPYIETAKQTKDQQVLGTVLDAYQSALAEAEDPASVTLDDSVVLEAMEVPNSAAISDMFQSKQLEDSPLMCFYDETTGTYGVYAEGRNGYVGMLVDNKGTQNKIGQKGDADTYFDKKLKRKLNLPTGK